MSHISHVRIIALVMIQGINPGMITIMVQGTNPVMTTTMVQNMDLAMIPAMPQTINPDMDRTMASVKMRITVLYLMWKKIKKINR